MTATRRLLCVYQHAPTPGAPGIYRHRTLFSELVRRGWAVDLVSTPVNYMTGVVPERYAARLYTRESIDGIVHHWVWASSGIHASRFRRTLNYVSFATSASVRGLTLPRPDVVLASSPPLSVGTVGALLARRFRRPWILEVRDIWPESAVSVGWLSESSPLYRALARLARRYTSGATEVIVPTPGLVERVREHGARAVTVVTGSVSDATGPPELRAEARAGLGVADNACVFLYLGALGVANGLDLLLDAVRSIQPSAPAACVVAGDGSQRQELERRIRHEGIEGVRVLGAVSKERVRELLAASDVCLHLLRPDPVFASALPTKVLEYFGAHRPFITTVPGLPERLALESSGGFASSAKELAAELSRWAEMSPEERRERGERSYAYGSEQFGLEVTVDRLEQALDRAIRR